MSQTPPDSDAQAKQKEIGQRLRNLRTALKLTQHQMAEKTGLKPPTYNRYETGGHAFTLGMLSFFAEQFNSSVAYVLTGKEPSPQKPIFHNSKATPDECYFINRYRALDERGKATVDTVLDFEYHLQKIIQSGQAY